MAFKQPEDVFIILLRSAYRNARHSAYPSTPLSTGISKSRTFARPLSSVAACRAIRNRPIGPRATRTRTNRLTQTPRLTFATVRGENENDKPRDIAILGGGITGLTAAHYLARYAPNANITLYEGSRRLGGWINGELKTVGDGEYDKVLFQRGPRVLRPGGWSINYSELVFYDVLASLNLRSQVLSFSSGSRYIYYPDHLVRLPSQIITPDNIKFAIRSYLSEPLYDGITKSILNTYLFKPYAKQLASESLEDVFARDESIGEFLVNTFQDDRVVNNIASAIAHGIYGGDVYKLSAKQSFLEHMWRRSRYPGPSGKQILEEKEMTLLHDIMDGDYRFEVIRIAEEMPRFKSIGFKDGLLTLVDALTKDLEHRKNVTIKRRSRVTSLAHKNGKMLVTTEDASGRTEPYDKVVCTLFSKHLAELVEPKGLLPSLADTHAVTMMVVNLWYPNPNLLVGKAGFGYLVPTSTPNNNDEYVLGVLFDSWMQPTSEIPGTKLTVMLGGHYWDGWEHFPSEEMGKQMAIQAVQRHLDIGQDEKVFASARLCRDCLPQHYVGHRERMSKAHYELLTAFKGQLTVAGPSYTSIGVIPAMRAGFDAGMRVARGHGPPFFRRLDPKDSWFPSWERKKWARPNDHIGQTGLEGFTQSPISNLCAEYRSELYLKGTADQFHRFINNKGEWMQLDEYRELMIDHDLPDDYDGAIGKPGFGGPKRQRNRAANGGKGNEKKKS